MLRTPPRQMAWSSTITIRIVVLICVVFKRFPFHPHMLPGIQYLVPVEANSPVTHFQLEVMLFASGTRFFQKQQMDARSLGMLSCICQRFLRDPVDSGLQ